MNPWLIVGALVALAAASAGGAYMGYDYRDAQAKAAEGERQLVIAQVRDANLDFALDVATATELAISKIRVTNKTINNEVRHEREIHTKVLDNPDCAVPPSTVRVLNRARAGERPDDRPAPGEPGLRLPATAPAPRPTPPGR